MSTLIHSDGQVVAFLRGENDGLNEKTISIYPSAFDTTDALSIVWCKTPDDAERLAHAVLAAVAAFRAHSVACPRCGAAPNVACVQPDPTPTCESACPERTALQKEAK